MNKFEIWIIFKNEQISKWTIFDFEQFSKWTIFKYEPNFNSNFKICIFLKKNEKENRRKRKTKTVNENENKQRRRKRKSQMGRPISAQARASSAANERYIDFGPLNVANSASSALSVCSTYGPRLRANSMFGPRAWWRGSHVRWEIPRGRYDAV